MERRLAAILAADVVAYSKLMGADESGTLQQLKSHRTDIFDPIVSKFNGRIIKLMGDGTLVEFSSVVDAVEAAVAIQTAVYEQSGPIQLRIGINLGDVIIDGDDTYGDGVNIAARLEGIAKPGGICVSSIVRESVGNRVNAMFTDGGEHNLKNIDSAVRVFEWTMLYPDAQSTSDKLLSKKGKSKRPSIAVLPFDNMSNDPEQDFLADGISEDLITALSKIRWFFVIARNSTFTYKGQAIDVKQVAAELGVQYVLEGSVRKAGSRVRITAQLIDAANGNHVWAERYDRQIEDIFDLQDEMTQTIIGAVEPEISAAERQRVVGTQPGSLDAWECYQRGVLHMWSYAKEDHEQARTMLNKANELDPNFAPAFAYGSYVRYQNVIMAWSDEIEKNLTEGKELAQRALEIDDKDSVAYFAVGRILMMEGRHDDSISALEAAVDLNPSFAQAHHGLGMVLCLAGRFEEANRANSMCEKLSPKDPINWASVTVQALTYILAEDYHQGLIWAEKVLRLPRASGYWPHMVHAASLAQLGRIDDAKMAGMQLLKSTPGYTIGHMAKTYPTKLKGGLDPLLDGLRLAGIPE